MKLLGIDVGTGGTRAVVVDERGGVVSSATDEHAPFASPRTCITSKLVHEDERTLTRRVV